jgi:hypothetical protein
MAVLVIVAVPVLLTGCRSSALREGATFADGAGFQKAVEQDGYLIIAEFEEGWPATITRITTGDGEVTLQVPGDAGRDYSGFDGYGMMAIVLKKEGGGQAGAVLRTKEMR